MSKVSDEQQYYILKNYRYIWLSDGNGFTPFSVLKTFERDPHCQSLGNSRSSQKFHWRVQWKTLLKPVGSFLYVNMFNIERGFLNILLSLFFQSSLTVTQILIFYNFRHLWKEFVTSSKISFYEKIPTFKHSACDSFSCFGELNFFKGVSRCKSVQYSAAFCK